MRGARSIALLGVGAAMTGATLLIGLTPATDSSELRTVDWRFALRGTQPPPDDVVAVVIDDDTYSALGIPWPFPRTMHAKVIRWLDDAGAKVIAYDVQFTEQSKNSREDNALMTAVQRTHGRTILSAGEISEYGETEVFGGNEQVEALGSRVGHTLVPLDADGVVRRMRREIDGLPSLAVGAVEVARRRPVPRSDFDADGTAWIDFAGPPGSIRTVSFADVYRGREDPGLFRGAVVVVGAASAEVRDVHSTSTSRDRQMSGVEIHANAIATLLDDTPLRTAPGWLTPALVVVFGLLAPLAAIRFGAIAVVIVAAVALAYVGLLQLAFQAGLILPALDPLIALALSGAGVFAVQFASMSAERNAARQVLGLFLPSGVVGEVMGSWAQGAELRSLTRSTETTCVFCDLRGFTDFSEMLTEADVERVLDRYLTEMSDAICLHQGTIVGYRGDGIVALFETPGEDHADNAVRAAREMAGPRLDALNRWIGEAGLGDGFDIGIGINSGTIRSGIIGSDRRLEYTAVGDAANVAARLEDETKNHQHQVLISGTTVAVLRREKPSLAYVGTIQIRGRKAPVSIYSLNGAPVA